MKWSVRDGKYFRECKSPSIYSFLNAPTDKIFSAKDLASKQEFRPFPTHDRMKEGAESIVKRKTNILSEAHRDSQHLKLNESPYLSSYTRFNYLS